MIITISGREFEKESLEFIDSIDRFSWQEFIYFTEILAEALGVKEEVDA